MPKVSVTLKTNRTQRKYEGDYAYVSVLNEDGVGNRWEQEPVGWKDGLGLFFCGMSAFRTVAEQKGKEGFKEAARAAMDLLAIFDPNSTEKEKETKAKRVSSVLEKLSGGSDKKKEKGKTKGK